LGSHLCDRMVEKGFDVLCLDNFFTGNKKNIAHLLDKANFELIRHDLTQPLFLEVDEIYNMACPASPIHYQHNPVKTVKTNVMGAIHMLGMAKRVRAKILQASTSEIYGNPEIHPQKEDYWGNVNTIGLRSCYDEGKRCAETLFFDYHRQNGVNASIYRLGNLIGHSQSGRFQENIDESWFYSRLKTYISIGVVPIDVGQDLRMSFIDQAACATVKLALCRSLDNEIFHIYNPHTFNLPLLARMLNQLGVSVKALDTFQFYEHLLENLGHPILGRIARNFVLHSYVLEEPGEMTTGILMSERTQKILGQMGFQWSPFGVGHLEKMFSYMRQAGYLV